MKKKLLGKTGLKVTELCFGALPMGPLQKNLPEEEAAEILSIALQGGVNFIDTAQGYKTYGPIRLALKTIKERPIIASKSPAETYGEMQQAVDQALNNLELDELDIFHLHAARAGEDVFAKRRGALECLLDNKRQGRIRAIGISTHSVKVTALASTREEIDVVFPIMNKQGLGLLEGNREEMERAIAQCVTKGKGVYLMKVLAGGSLVGDYDQALDYARSLPGCSSIAIGMVTREEVEYNLAYFEGRRPESLPSLEAMKKRFLVVKSLCAGCLKCVDVCPNHAIISVEGKALIQEEKCLTCGYCVGVCPQFAIRLV
ncbi:MAG TPA: aldo/keto reductase [Firmicutes bacterium]|jgi:predicted aldo/keto reductase-like oxidoreductase|nr:aldo/keto reductase [Bacillota bacterium]